MAKICTCFRNRVKVGKSVGFRKKTTTSTQNADLKQVKNAVSELQKKLIGSFCELDALSSMEYKSHQNLQYFLPCIHRIPPGICKLNKTAYNPSMVSIGLLHSGEEHLKTMEVVKLSYMTRLFKRAQSDQWETLTKLCLPALSGLEDSARKYYATEIINAEARKKDATFLVMMLIDGCFIIELLLRSHENENENEDVNDPILLNNMRYVSILRDLLLLENQIPFIVLEELYKLIILDRSNKYKVYHSLTECIFSFFPDMIGLDQTWEIEEEDTTTVCHILHLLYKRYLYPELHKQPTTYIQKNDTGTCNCIIQISQKNKSGAKETWEDFKYSATELDMSGVKLEAGNRKKLFDVKFSTDSSCFRLCRRARFEIPPFCISDDTEIFLRNAIAFEQTCVGKNHFYFTSHALLMDKLINSADDVKLLEEKGIIRNHLGSREEVSILFNNICKNISIDNFYFEEPCIRVNEYCKQWWPKFLVKLRREYLSSPWTIISIIAAFILFALTTLQTVYTLLSHYH